MPTMIAAEWARHGVILVVLALSSWTLKQIGSDGSTKFSFRCVSGELEKNTHLRGAIRDPCRRVSLAELPESKQFVGARRHRLGVSRQEGNTGHAAIEPVEALDLLTRLDVPQSGGVV